MTLPWQEYQNLELDERIWWKRRVAGKSLCVLAVLVVLAIVFPMGTALAKGLLSSVGLAKLDREYYGASEALFQPDRREIAWIDFEKGQDLFGCGEGVTTTYHERGGVVGFRDGSIAGYWRLKSTGQKGQAFVVQRD